MALANDACHDAYLYIIVHNLEILGDSIGITYHKLLLLLLTPDKVPTILTIAIHSVAFLSPDNENGP